jgi:hypothetical protein
MRKFHALLRETEMESYRKDIIEGYGVESARDLTDDDLKHAVDHLTQIKASALNYQLRKLRSVVLTLLQKLGIYSTNNDWTAVNNYLLSPRIAGKMLFELNETQLEALIIKLNSILAKHKEKEALIDRLIKNN